MQINAFLVRWIPTLVFVVAIVIDCVNGYIQIDMAKESFVGVLFRGMILVVLLPYLFFNRRIGELVMLLIIVLGTCITWWVVFCQANLFEEINYLIRLSFVYLLFCFFYVNWHHYKRKKLYGYISWYGVIVAGVIIVCFFLGIGHDAYHDYGWGSKGLFKAGNDTSIVLLLSLIITCIAYNKYGHTSKGLLKMGVIGLGAILTGSRVGIFGTFITLLVEGFFLLKSGRTTHKLVLLTLVGFILPPVVISVYSSFSDYALARFSWESISSARGTLTDLAMNHFNGLSGLSMLIGEGRGNLYRQVAFGYGGVNSRDVEADFHDLIGSYGCLLGAMFMLFYFYVLLLSFWRYYQYRNQETTLYSLLFILYIGIAYTAGHVASNLMVAPVFAIAANDVIYYRREKFTGEWRITNKSGKRTDNNSIIFFSK